MKHGDSSLYLLPCPIGTRGQIHRTVPMFFPCFTRGSHPALHDQFFIKIQADSPRYYFQFKSVGKDGFPIDVGLKGGAWAETTRLSV